MLTKSVLKNDCLEVEYLMDSLRIIGLTPAGKTNMLADLGNLPAIPTPVGDFRCGGHRLWHAPESMPCTYIPDTLVTAIQLPDGVSWRSGCFSGLSPEYQEQIVAQTN